MFKSKSRLGARLADLMFLPVFILTNLIVLPVAAVLDAIDGLDGKRA